MANDGVILFRHTALKYVVINDLLLFFKFDPLLFK